MNTIELNPADRLLARRMLAMAWSWWVALLVLMLTAVGLYLVHPAVLHRAPRIVRDVMSWLGDRLTVHASVAVIAWCVWLVLVVTGLYLRSQIFKRFWRGHAVAPIGFLLGHLAAWVLADVGVLLAVVLACLGRDIDSDVALTVGVGVVIHVLLWPTGAVMRPFDGQTTRPHDLSS